MTTLDSLFLKKIYLVSAILTVPAFLCAWYWFGFSPASGVVIGGVFGIVNTHIIYWLTRCTLIPSSRNPIQAVIAFTLKIPIVWGLLILGFSMKWIDPIGFLVGFQVFILSIVAVAIQHHVSSEKASSGQIAGGGEAL